MAIQQNPVDVLMSIHPRHAEQILSGRKKVEFRRKPPKRPVSHIIVYATAPLKRIVGIARVLSVVEGSLDALWTQYGTIGGITRDEFNRYFTGVSEGSVLLLAEPTILTEPQLTTDVIFDRVAPQSFMYVPAAVTKSLVLA
jgi:predicted transcriptional regulator